MNRVPVRAEVEASVEEGLYCVFFKFVRDKGEKVHAKSCEGRFAVDGSGDSIV